MDIKARLTRKYTLQEEDFTVLTERPGLDEYTLDLTSQQNNPVRSPNRLYGFINGECLILKMEICRRVGLKKSAGTNRQGLFLSCDKRSPGTGT